MAGVRHADRGAPPPWAGRRVAGRPRGADAAGSRRRVTATPVWVVVADPLTARTFFDCRIVELAARLGERLRVAFTFRGPDADEWAARVPAGVTRFHVDDLYPDAVPLPERAARRADRWLDEQIGYLPRSGSTCVTASIERMPGHRNQLLDSNRVGPLPVRPRVEQAMPVAFSPRRHVASALRRRLDSERPVLVLSNSRCNPRRPSSCSAVGWA